MNSSQESAVDLETVLDDPLWFLDAVDPAGCGFSFVKTSRALLQESAFLDHRMSEATGPRADFTLTAGDFATIESPHSAHDPAGFIFHTSFCRSTLLARALHREGASFSLKEPGALVSLAHGLRAAGAAVGEGERAGLIDAVLTFLGRPLAQGERVLIKPSNFANSLLPAVLAQGGRVLLMYSELRPLLLSILKRGEEGRIFVRRLFNALRMDPVAVANIPAPQAMLFTDLEVAALVWRQQMETFVEALQSWPDAGLRTLDAEVLRARPEETLRAAFDFFEIEADEKDVREVVQGAVFMQDSKQADRPYSPAREAEMAREAERVFADSIARTLDWASQARLRTDIALPLARPLLG